MTRLTDGKRIIEISMYTRDPEKYGPLDPDYYMMDQEGWLPWFCEDVWLGLDDMEIDETTGAYITDDLNWDIEQLEKWENKAGRFKTGTGNHDRLVSISILVGTPEMFGLKKHAKK